MKRLYTLLFLITVFFSGCTQMVITMMNKIDLTELAIQDKKLYLLGDFNSKSYDQVTSVLRKHPEVRTIVLTANSGSIDDDTTFKLARYIREKKLNTHLLSNSTIASGAVDLFCAGVQRTIEKGAKLGVHSWSDGSKEAKDFPKDAPEHTLNATYTKDMLGSDAFYWFTIYAASADSISWMSEKNIKKFALTTSDFLPPSADITPFQDKFLEERKVILED